ncbi:hypothetical protein [Treponema putidum]|uniref:Small-conductance mechanosensitive channel n=1 Tax=Treponema putidum TaxID=221027 RepID=A0AAE9SKX4_9SPIR|nr:hypothetical protein [Treponema putidum]AIN94215.1 hypothetical protein JO40_08945 [Treponema putidum]TWI79682.1 hypothetical protein JM98_00113 [Treponema putidum]UTY28170.1 hypothetical protein E4N76_03620 [Treponema putidum]UTY33079.1 hypothetical protein E4N74_02915 [Treponema putidum]
METTNNLVTDYENKFIPGIHKWGRLSMLIALILSFLPIGYMYFVKGWSESASAFASVTIAIASFGIGMWLTEPMSYFPILGSAGTYMGYFAGNVSNMRVPVALSIQNALKSDVTEPRGNIATIIAVATSVFVNLCILLIVIIVGQKLLTVFPPVVIKSFKYVLPSLFGSLIVMRFKGEPKKAIKYFIPTAIIYYLIGFIPGIGTFKLAIVIGGTIIYGYIFHKIEKNKKAE